MFSFPFDETNNKKSDSKLFVHVLIHTRKCTIFYLGFVASMEFKAIPYLGAYPVHTHSVHFYHSIKIATIVHPIPFRKVVALKFDTIRASQVERFVFRNPCFFFVFEKCIPIPKK